MARWMLRLNGLVVGSIQPNAWAARDAGECAAGVKHHRLINSHFVSYNRQAVMCLAWDRKKSHGAVETCQSTEPRRFGAQDQVCLLYETNIYFIGIAFAGPPPAPGRPAASLEHREPASHRPIGEQK